MSDESLGENTGNAAERIIARFGGIRPMASKLEIAVSTVQGWKNRGQIPPARREQIERAAKELDIDLETGELDAATGAVGASPQLPAPSAQTEEAAPAGTSLENEQMDETPWGGVGNADPSERPDDPPVGEGPGPSGTHQKANPLPLMLLGGLLVAAGAAVAILLSDYWMPAQEPPLAASVEALERRMARVEEQRADTSEEALPTLQRDLEQTRARLEELDGRVATLAEEVNEEPADLEALHEVAEQLTAKLEALDARVTEVAEAPAEPDDATRGQLAGIEGRIEGVTGKVEAWEARLNDAMAALEAVRVRLGEEATVALAAGQLREAFRTGQPYATELEGLRRLSDRDKDLDDVLTRLEAHAGSGVPTMATLRAGYSEAARAAVAAERSGGSDNEWTALFWERVSDLVSVRASGDAAGDDTEAILARAEQRLEAGDLAATLSELSALEGPAAQAMKDWREQAEARLEAEESLAALNRIALGRLDGAEG